MSNVVLDASALLAFIRNEPGADVVAASLDEAVMSAVNLSEVVAKLSEAGMDASEIRVSLDALGIEIVACDAEMAYRAGLLRLVTKSFGLSLGDRICLALAEVRGVPALTSDQAPLHVQIQHVR